MGTKDVENIGCIPCKKEGKIGICRGWTGLCTHLRKSHNILYSPDKKNELGYKTTKTPTSHNSKFHSTGTESISEKIDKQSLVQCLHCNRKPLNRKGAYGHIKSHGIDNPIEGSDFKYVIPEKRQYKKRAKKELARTMGLKAKGVLSQTGEMITSGDRIYIPAMIELTYSIQARMIEPDEHNT